MRIIQSILILFLSVLVACQQPAQNRKKVEENPSHPVMALWDGFVFSDTTLIHRPDVTERRFSTFLAALHRIAAKEHSVAISQLMAKAHNASPRMYAHLHQLAEKYLQNPNSPFRDEELYIHFLMYVVENKGTEEAMRERARFQLNMAMKNRQGTLATDFHYITSDNQQGSLYELNSEYLLLLFYHPECDECRLLKRDIIDSPLLTALQRGGRMKVLALYPDEDIAMWQQHLHDNPSTWITTRYATQEDAEAFHLNATPTLYLLNHEKRVLLKDSSLEDILNLVTNLQRKGL